LSFQVHGLCEEPPPVVLDPFAGVGTTPLAARRLGCGYVAFDIDEGYAAHARERLCSAQSHLP
jgi:DNA modification methylase